MSLSQWVREALDHAEMTQVELARRMTEWLGRSIDKAAVNKMLLNDETARAKGLKARRVGADEMVAIEAITGYPAPNRRDQSLVASYDPDDDPEEVLTFEPGVSTLTAYEGSVAGAMPDLEVAPGAGPGDIAAPHVMPAGGVMYSADAVRGEVVLPSYLLSEYTRADAGRVHVLRIRGDSMETTLASGDRVLVDTTDTAIGQGGVFVILDPDNEVLVKRLRKLPKGRVEVISDNPKQAPDVHSLSDIRVIGRAVARLCRI